MPLKKNYKHTPPICLFLPSLVGGGAERVFVTIANEIASRNISIDLIIADGEHLDYLSEVSSRVNTIILGVPRTLLALPKLTAYLSKTKPVSLMTTMAQANLVGKMALSLANSKRTRHIIRQAIAPGIVPIKNALITSLLKPIVSLTYRRANCVISVSREMTKLLKQQYNIDSNVRTIYNPVDFEHIMKLASNTPDKSPPWNDGSFCLILGIGRLNKQKDFQTLIEAFSKVQKEKNAKLIILGEGPERTSLETTIEKHGLTDHIWMPGFIQNPFPYIMHATVFVLSSRYEGLPNALIQALILGTPCVSTRCPTGPAEILEDGRLGTLVDIGASDNMATAIIRSSDLPKPDPTDQLTIQNKYSISKITDQYLAVLQPEQHYELADPPLHKPHT